jgi:hypothetical protein
MESAMSEEQKPDPQNLPRAKDGAHPKEQGDQVKSRSADPGQSSYGGFKGEDPRRQVQDLDDKKDKGRGQ